MTCFVALLRAVNVGGSGALPMPDLKAICEAAGFGSVRTHIASGNVVFTSPVAEPEAKAALEENLHRYAGKPIGVLLRNAAEIAGTLRNNPFADAPANRVVALFLGQTVSAATLVGVTGGNNGEALRLGSREIYIHYPNGIGVSKLRIPRAHDGTARNMNTVAKLAAMAAADVR